MGGRGLRASIRRLALACLYGSLKDSLWCVIRVTLLWNVNTPIARTSGSVAGVLRDCSKVVPSAAMGDPRVMDAGIVPRQVSQKGLDGSGQNQPVGNATGFTGSKPRRNRELAYAPGARQARWSGREKPATRVVIGAQTEAAAKRSAIEEPGRIGCVHRVVHNIGVLVPGLRVGANGRVHPRRIGRKPPRLCAAVLTEPRILQVGLRIVDIIGEAAKCPVRPRAVHSITERKAGADLRYISAGRDHHPLGSQPISEPERRAACRV